LTSSWNVVFRTPELNLCQLTAIAKLFPTYEVFINSLKKSIPNIPLSCPIKAGPFEFRNVTIDDNTVDEDLQFKGNGKYTSNLPNGQHRTTLKFFNSADPIGVKVQWVNEVKGRLQIDNF
jgi:Protein of unknown function (DUF1091)